MPRFRSSAYVAEISENAQKNTPVTWLGGDTVAEVFDHDLGSNGTFTLFLEGDKNMFEVRVVRNLAPIPARHQGDSKLGH